MLNKTKKISILLIAALLLIACGSGKKGESAEGKTVTVWYHPFVGADQKDDLLKVFSDMEAEFKKENADVTVVFEEIPWADREQKITTTLSANQGPDIYYLIPDQLTQFADNGLVQPLKEYLGDMDLSDYSEQTLASVSYKDDLYGLPILRESQTLFYNKAILEEIGGDVDNLPTTWAEFNELGQKAVDAGYYARTYDGANSLNSSMYPLIWQAGGDIVNDKDEIFINNEKSVKAFEQVNEWYQNGFISKESITSEDSTPDFLEGKILAAWNAGALIGMLDDAGLDFVIGSPLKEEKEVTFGVTGAFVVSSKSENPELAAKFLEVMTNTENSREFNKVTGYIPPRSSAQDIFEGNDNMKLMAEYVSIASPGVIHPKARIFMPDLQANIQAMLEGKLSPQEAADEAAKIIQNHIDQK